VGGKFSDKEIGEFQEKQKKKNTETDRAQKNCEVEMSFVLVRINYKCCGLFMKFNGLTDFEFNCTECVCRVQRRPKLQIINAEYGVGKSANYP
jgi:hypothetical protein